MGKVPLSVSSPGIHPTFAAEATGPWSQDRGFVFDLRLDLRNHGGMTVRLIKHEAVPRCESYEVPLLGW